MQAMMLVDELELDGTLGLGGEEVEEKEDKEDVTMKDNRDNRNIAGDHSAQKLTNEEIESLIEKNKNKGMEIINTLIANNDTWDQRTKFSQAKYIKFKKQKYQVTFETRMPTAEELTEVYLR
jgi:hypothetical protein